MVRSLSLRPFRLSASLVWAYREATASRAEGRAGLARALLAARGIEVSPGFPGVPGFAEMPDHVIAEAAAACVSEADFRERLRNR